MSTIFRFFSSISLNAPRSSHSSRSSFFDDAKAFDNEKGATFVEATIALPVFFFLVFGSLELLRLGYYSLSTQFVATSVLRSASLGPVEFMQERYVSAESPFEEYVVDEIIARSARFGVKLASENIEVRCLTESGCSNQSAIAGAMVRVTIARPTDALVVGQITIRNSSLAQNELWVF